MILVRFSQLVAILVLAFAGTLGSAVWAYTLAMRAGMKGDAEQVLFYGLLLGVFMLVSFLVLLAFARRKSREFETLADLVRYGGSISDERLDSFGFFGVQVKSMIRELADASERKSIRIASLTGLVRAVVELTDRSILIIGLDGRIVAASESIIEVPAFTGLRVGVSSIAEFLPELELQSVLEEADRSHGIVERQEHVSFIPVYSVNGEITHFLVELGKKGTLEAIAEMLQAKKSPNGRKAREDAVPLQRAGLGKRFRDYFSGGRPKPGSSR
jgi:hypothetical protein